MKRNTEKILKTVAILLLTLSLAACFFGCGDSQSQGEENKEEPAETSDVIDSEKEELVEIYNNIEENVEIGTAGSFLKAVPYSADLLKWIEKTKLTALEVKDITVEWLSEQGKDIQEKFNNNLSLVDNVCMYLLGDDAKDLMESAGLSPEQFSLSDSASDIFNTIMEAAGINQNNMDSEESEPVDESTVEAKGWKEEFEKSLLENYDVTVDHYEDIGDGVYQVYVEIDGKVVPYVAVDSKTGDYHG